MGEMTNEQAARWLKDLLKSDLPMEQYETAIKKGIEALKPSGDLISREETLTAFADYVGSGMSMNDYDALWDIVVKMPPVKQEPKFIAKSDGTIEQIKECDDCLFKKEWEKIGKLLSVVLEKQTEQEPKTGRCKNCKYFVYDSVANVDGIPLILAHEICSRWGDGCKTREDGYCFLFEPQESEG